MSAPSLFGAALFLSALGTIPAAAQVAPIETPGRVSLLEPLGDKRVLAGMADGKWYVVRVGKAGALDFEPTVAPKAEPVPRDILPDSRTAHGTRNIRAAWLVEPTVRYRHGVMGDAIEAGGLRVTTAAGATVTSILPDDAVIEDLSPRIADLDGDGRDEILVVRSGLADGAALAAYDIALAEGGQPVLSPAAQSDPLGAANRWLNPVGVADLDGDGRIEVAAVTTPHRGGVLRIYRQEGDRFAELAAADGFSNHVIGSTELRLSTIFDTDRDGRPELVVPSADRRDLRVMAFDGSRLTERARHRLPSPASTALLPLDGRLVVGLEDGRLAAILF